MGKTLIFLNTTAITVFQELPQWGSKYTGVAKIVIFNGDRHLSPKR